jgi:hypothetical protein
LLELSLLAGAVSDGRLLLSALAERLSDRRGGGADWLCDGCCDGGRTLLASAAVLLPTRPAKISLPDESDAGRANFGGAFERDTMVAASDVTLCTDGLSE